MLMRDALPRHNRLMSAWTLVGVLAAILVPSAAVWAADAAATPAATGTAAAAPAATPSAAPAAAPIPTPAVAPAATPSAAAAIESPSAPPSLAGTASEAAATGHGDMGVPVSVASDTLQTPFRQMLHYYQLAKFDLAKAQAEKLLAAKPTPEAVLAMVESPFAGYDMVLVMSRVPEMGDVVGQILTLADEGARIKRTDAARIQANLIRLGQGTVANQQALKELAFSGPYVVPFALAFLQDPSQKALWPEIQRALIFIGKPVVQPMTRALATPDTKLRETIVMILGEINYPYALPSLKALLEDSKQPQGVKAAATRAIQKMGDESILDKRAKTLFMNLAELYLSGKVAVADPRQPTTDVFDWVPGTGLLYRAAPSQCVNDILAVRACTDALKIEPDAVEVVSLWIIAMMDMEGKTPGKMAREDDPFLPDTMPSVDFFAESVGQTHLYRLLDRALRDQNTPIAVRGCQALGKVANQDFLRPFKQGEVASPLVVALTYPDQRVRYEAAFALVAVRPTEKFVGYPKVVPALVEALNLEAQKSILLVEPSDDNRNRLQAKFKDGGWNVVTAPTGNQALSAAKAMLRIDAILISSRTKDVSHSDLVTLLRNNYETALTPILILSYADDTSKGAWLGLNIPYLKSVDPAAETDVLQAEIDGLKKKAGSVVLNGDATRAVSLRAAEALKDIAMTSHVYEADLARLSLLEALTNRPDELVAAVAAALAQIPDVDVEKALAKLGTDESRSKPVRVAALKALGRTARSIGKKIDDAQIATLQAMAGTTDDQLRDAAGEALGGLNLDASYGAKLILKHGDVQSTTPGALAPVPAPAPEEPAAAAPVTAPAATATK
jgi:HEAT repeat protein/CheY-like chemotaxis protein